MSDPRQYAPWAEDPDEDPPEMTREQMQAAAAGVARLMAARRQQGEPAAPAVPQAPPEST
jgi:hypothetical protein